MIATAVQVETAQDKVRRIVRESMDAAESADPAVVAKVVLDALTPKLMREALEMMLPEYVRRVMSSYGWTQKQTAQRPTTSADRIRSWYQNQLGVSLFTGDGWKFLRECTADDLHSVAAERYKKATQTHAEGDRWSKVAIFMEENDRTTVASIREDELKSLLEAS